MTRDLYWLRDLFLEGQPRAGFIFRRTTKGIVNLTKGELGSNDRMSTNTYRRYRWRAYFISDCVWLHNCFCLSFRDIEKMMRLRGIEVTYQTIRDCHSKFAWDIANQIRRRRPQLSRKWHLDQMRVEITPINLLAMAGGRWTRSGFRYLDAKTHRCQGSQEILSENHL